MDQVLQWGSLVASELKTLSALPVVLGIIQTESGGDPNAKGPVGEIGLMQLRPEFHAPNGDASKLWDPKTNIKIGVAFFESLISRYKGDLMRAIAAYNAGAGRVDPGGAIPNRSYVSKVLEASKHYAGSVALQFWRLVYDWRVLAGVGGAALLVLFLLLRRSD